MMPCIASGRRQRRQGIIRPYGRNILIRFLNPELVISARSSRKGRRERSTSATGGKRDMCKHPRWSRFVPLFPSRVAFPLKTSFRQVVFSFVVPTLIFGCGRTRVRIARTREPARCAATVASRASAHGTRRGRIVLFAFAGTFRGTRPRIHVKSFLSIVCPQGSVGFLRQNHI